MIDYAQPEKGRLTKEEIAPLTMTNMTRLISIRAPRIFKMIPPETKLDRVAKAPKRKSPARRLASL